MDVSTKKPHLSQQEFGIAFSKDARELERYGANPIISYSNKYPKFPLFHALFPSTYFPNETFETLRGADFQKSHFGVTTANEQIRVYDDTIRLSDVVRVNVPPLEKIAGDYLYGWSKRDRADIFNDESWNMLRYVNGHFTWHKDKVRPKQGYEHIGTQIVLPPFSIQRYKGGCLRIKEKYGKMLQIYPDEVDWTYVIIPLGYEHCVDRVEGMRYSFTKEIYFVENGLNMDRNQ